MDQNFVYVTSELSTIKSIDTSELEIVKLLGFLTTSRDFYISRNPLKNLIEQACPVNQDKQRREKMEIQQQRLDLKELLLEIFCQFTVIFLGFFGMTYFLSSSTSSLFSSSPNFLTKNSPETSSFSSSSSSSSSSFFDCREKNEEEDEKKKEKRKKGMKNDEMIKMTKKSQEKFHRENQFKMFL